MPDINIPRDTTLQELVAIQKLNNKALNMIAVAQAANVKSVEDWAGVAQLVRQGLGPVAFPIGSQLRSTHSVYGEIVWDVVDHDEDHGRMTILSHDVAINSMQYDQVEALYYCENALSAGTYHFTIPNYDATYGGNATYQFTLTKDVPAKGHVVLNWAYQKPVTDGTVVTYSAATSTTAIESVKPMLGSGGTDLGTADGNSPNMNHIHRARYGSNNWKESNMRAFLNSKAAAGGVFSAQTKYDRPASWNATTAGFMAGFDNDFLTAVVENENQYKTNTVYDENGTTQAYTTKDYFWLPSVNEVGFSTESGIAEGKRFAYYEGATNADRIKYNSSATARYWWLRSPYPSGANGVRIVATDGSLGSLNAHNSYAVAPACVIG